MENFINLTYLVVLMKTIKDVLKLIDEEISYKLSRREKYTRKQKRWGRENSAIYTLRKIKQKIQGE